MTPRERARQATQEAGTPDWGSDDQEQLEMAVEQAIIAAVAEKDARIKELEAAVAHLRASNAALTSKIRANSTASSTPQED